MELAAYDIYTKILNNKIVVIKGETGSGKSTLMDLVFEQLKRAGDNSRTARILFFSSVNNSEIRALHAVNLHNFVKNEVRTFYPLLSNCDIYRHNSAEPVFVNADETKYLIAKVIDNLRNTELKFCEIIADNAQLANQIFTCMNMCVLFDVEPELALQRYEKYFLLPQPERLNILEHAISVIARYRSRCVKNGIFDISSALWYYKKYILTNPVYVSNFRARFDYVLFDDIESAAKIEAQIVKEWSNLARGFCACANVDAGYGVHGEDMIKYVLNLFKDEAVFFELDSNKENNKKQDKRLYYFADCFYNMLVHGSDDGQKCRHSHDSYVIRHKQTQFRNEMIRNAAYRIIDIVKNEKIKPSDICVLASYADPVTFDDMDIYLSKEGIKLSNDMKFDNVENTTVISVLITLIRTAYPQMFRAPDFYKINSLLKFLFCNDKKLISVIGSIIASRIRNRSSLPLELALGEHDKKHYFDVLEDYKLFASWINNHIKEQKCSSCYSFFKGAFENLIYPIAAKRVDIKKEDIISVKTFLDKVENFEKNVSLFGQDPAKNVFEYLTKWKKLSIFSEAELALDETSVRFTTPQLFLKRSCTADVLIVLGISSKNWYSRNAGELLHPWTYNPFWTDDIIYNEVLEEEMNKKRAANLFRAVFKRVNKRIELFESRLSISLQPNEGMLSDIFDIVIRA